MLIASGATHYICSVNKRIQFTLRMRQKKCIYITFTVVIKHVLYTLRGLVASEKESNGLRFLSLARNDLRCVMTCGIQDYLAIMSRPPVLAFE